MPNSNLIPSRRSWLLLAVFALATFVFGIANSVHAAARTQLPPAGVAISQVTVKIGPELEKKAREYGVRDVETLRQQLESETQKALGKKGRLNPNGGRLELVLADAVPNRPTFEQLGNKPGLSYESFAIGSARIEGQYVGPDGQTSPIWFEDRAMDIQQSRHTDTWYDAYNAISRFARELTR